MAATCEICSQVSDECTRYAENDDGYRYERTDGSFGQSDLVLCPTCGWAWLEARPT